MSTVRLSLALAICILWAVSYVVSVVQHDFTGFEVATPIMGIAAGFLLGTEIIKRRNGNGR